MPNFEILTADQLIERLKGRKYKYSQIHHTYRPNHANFTGSNHIRLQQGMYENHTQVRGWDNIGQHVTLMPDGKFVTGRPFDSTPAGIAGYNTGAFMTEMVGDFDLGKDKLQGAQLEAILKVQNFIINNCGASIMFHREHAPKTCPGTGIDKGDFLKKVITYKEAAKEPVTTGPKVEPYFFQSTKGPIAKVIVIRDDVVIHAAPNTNSDITRKAKKGEVFDVYGNINDWHAVGGANWIFGNNGKNLSLNLDALKVVKPPFIGLLKEGSKNEQVKLVQKIVGVAADGIFGPGTEAAVIKWQKVHGLTADGVVGPATWEKMF